MKKLVLAASLALLLPTLVFAQGTVSFNTIAATAVTGNQWFQFADLSRAPGGTSAQLWWSPDGVAAYSQIAANTVTVNGWITTPVLATTGGATAGGALAFFYVAGSVNNPAGQPAGLYTGQTAPFQNGTGNPAGQPTPTPPADLTGWTTAVTLTSGVVPEPSTIALAGLGLASLLIFRRRK